MKELNKKGKITCWKVYKKNKKSLSSVYYGQNIKRSGVIVSNRQNEILGRIELIDGFVDLGIHVYTAEKEARFNSLYYMPKTVDIAIVIPVTCYKKDLIAQGDCQEAVFNQVEITRETWNEIFPK